MYDWAASAFATTIMAVFLPIFFRNVAAVTLLETQQHLATSLWGYTTAIAMSVVAVLSLILGPVSDYASSKKRLLSFLSLYFTLLITRGLYCLINSSQAPGSLLTHFFTSSSQVMTRTL